MSVIVFPLFSSDGNRDVNVVQPGDGLLIV